MRGVDPGQVQAGQAMGMTPGALMRRVIWPHAIRTMVPALGSETVSALKNSSWALVIAVEELTLRSTQLASSTFDFFSIFFASGLMYLALTGAVSATQIAVETLLDLDHAPARDRLRHLLPWRSGTPTPAPARPATALPAAASAVPQPQPAIAAPDRSARSAALAAAPFAIEIAGLRKRYGAQPVLDGLDLAVRSGEVIALLGPSGSGKSTLLRCITLLESWDGGTIRVGGRRLGFREDGRPMPPRAVANERAAVGVGMVFQQFNLFGHLTALENVAGPLRWVHAMPAPEADRRARDLLARVGLSHRADALPRHLSGGQQQRVAIARVLAPRPSVLMLDEPTSALDPELVNEVLDVIRRLSAEDGLTMIISTHQLRFAREVADRVIFLSGGAVAEEGPADEILSRPLHPLTARFLRVMGADALPETAA